MNNNIETGARNPLLNCAEAKAGDQVLLVGEQCAAPYFDPCLCDDLSSCSMTTTRSAIAFTIEPVADRLASELRFWRSPGAAR